MNTQNKNNFGPSPAPRRKSNKVIRKHEVSSLDLVLRTASQGGDVEPRLAPKKELACKERGKDIPGS